MGLGKGNGRGGPRPGSGRKPFSDKMYTLTLYLSEEENDAAHLIAHEQGLPISRFIGGLIMAAYNQRVIKGE